MTSLFPRGGESDFTLVLVDGIRANAFGGGLDLSQVPLQESIASRWCADRRARSTAPTPSAA